MNKKYLRASLGAAAAILLVLTITYLHDKQTAASGSGSYALSLPAAAQSDDPMRGIDEESYAVSSSFETHLPIVILNTGGIQPPISTENKFVDGEWRFVEIAGVEPYVSGSIRIIDTGGVNRITDRPAAESLISIKRRGNSSMLYEKAQYLIKMMTESGEENAIDVLSMGADNEWILNGSMADKSMLRNYLAYQTASQIFPYTPDYKYCEVIYQNGDTYQYGGVYLIGETIRQGENRVAIESSKTGGYASSFIVRRDRFDEKDTMLYTGAYNSGLYKTTTGSSIFGAIYPGKSQITDEMTAYITERLNCVEAALYSDDLGTFSTYPKLINVDSFVDYFLFNEFFGSYDSGTYSTYLYSESGGKLTMGPVWDYDGTMDNYRSEALDVTRTAFQIKPWFRELASDRTFMELLKSRYAELRRGCLGNEAIQSRIDEIVAYLGPAQKREWARWGFIYATDNEYSLLGYVDEENDFIYRNCLDYDSEILRIKTSLQQHGDAILPHLAALENSCVRVTGWSSRTDIALLLTLLVLVISVLYIRRS